MTIASEITRLQTAKSDARTSIINKWVDVPASAKLDTYHDYIDLIQQWWGLSDFSWVRLYNNFVSSKNWTPVIWEEISWEDNWSYYWCLTCSIEWSSADSLWFYVYRYRRIAGTTWDFWYNIYQIWWDTSPRIYQWPRSTSFWEKDGVMKIIFFKYNRSTSSDNDKDCYEVNRTYWTDAISDNFLGSWTTRDPNDYTDLTWWTQITTKDWVGSVTPNSMNNTAYIYLTLK